jgi:hypothetical protein
MLWPCCVAQEAVDCCEDADRSAVRNLKGRRGEVSHTAGFSVPVLEAGGGCIGALGCVFREPHSPTTEQISQNEIWPHFIARTIANAWRVAFQAAFSATSNPQNVLPIASLLPSFCSIWGRKIILKQPELISTVTLFTRIAMSGKCGCTMLQTSESQMPPRFCMAAESRLWIICRLAQNPKCVQNGGTVVSAIWVPFHQAPYEPPVVSS